MTVKRILRHIKVSDLERPYCQIEFIENMFGQKIENISFYINPLKNKENLFTLLHELGHYYHHCNYASFQDCWIMGLRKGQLKHMISEIRAWNYAFCCIKKEALPDIIKYALSKLRSYMNHLPKDLQDHTKKEFKRITGYIYV